MKQEQLQQIINKLETDKNFAITVKNSTGFKLVCNATNEALIAKNGSAKDFFETLYKSGTKSVTILPRKRNGSYTGGKPNYMAHPTIATLEFNFEPLQTEPTVYPAPPIQQPIYPQGLNGMAGVEVYRVHDYDRISNALIKSEAKCEMLETKVKDLEKENLTNELLGTKSVQKSQAQADLLDKGKEYVPLLLEIIKGRNPVQVGLGQAQNLSVIKQQFMNADDDFLNELMPVATGMQNSDFVSKLNVLLTEFNLICTVKL